MKQRIPIWAVGALVAGVVLVGAILARFAYLDLTAISVHRGESDEGSAVAASAAEQRTLGQANPGFLYGRVVTDGGGTYEGRLRFGGDQEAFWGDYFNGTKTDNPWAAQVRPGQLPDDRRPFEIFGFAVGPRPRTLSRPFMARFGDIARIEAERYLVRVTLKSGTVFNLDRLEASDFDDGVRVWDAQRGVVDIADRKIRTIDLLPTARLVSAPGRLYGTVRTPRGAFTGSVQWNRQACLVSDTLDGRTGGEKRRVRFDTIRSITRETADSSRVTLVDGREIVLSGSQDVGRGNRGVYVDDPRYGRVLITWDAFERVDVTRGPSGPAYRDFPEGRQLSGSVSTLDGRRLAGRLVYDLDESETTDTLDAPARGVDYTIPFGLVAAIARPAAGEGDATVTLQGGEVLALESAGDLGPDNGGVLVFVNPSSQPEYVPWRDVKALAFDRPPAMYPPFGG